MFNEALLTGLLLGLSLAIATGPSFMALLQTSIKNGLKWGIALAFGIFLSDVFYISLSYLGASQLLNSARNQAFIGIGGGVLLFIFGVYNLFSKKNPLNVTDIHYDRENIYITFTKGFLLNTLNPAVPVLWIGTMSAVAAQFNLQTRYIFIFFASALFTVLGTDILKALVAHKIKALITPNLQLLLNRILGLILIGMAINLIYQAWVKYPFQ